MTPSPNSPVPTLTTQPSIYSPQPVYHPNVRSPSLHSQTLSEFETTSKPSSILGPPLTRDHSAAATSSTADYLPTPTDEAMHPPTAPLVRNETTITAYYRNQAFSEPPGPSHSAGKVQNGEGIRERQHLPTSQGEPSTLTRANAQVKITARRRVLPLEQRATAGPSPAFVTAPRMTRRPSAQEIISQYNELDSSAQASISPSVSPDSNAILGTRTRSVSSVTFPARQNALLPPVPAGAGDSGTSPSPRPTNPPRAPPSHCLPESPTYFSSFTRSRGKMRDSFTNLMQLLGDKAKAKDKDGGNSLKPGETPKKGNSISPSASFRAFSSALPRSFKLNVGKRTSSGSGPCGPSGKDKTGEGMSTSLPDMNELLKSKPDMSDLLLYQSPARQRHSASSHVRWMPYTVSIYPTSIILQIPNPGLSSTDKFQIPVSDIYDTHSLASKELPPEIIAVPGSLPPGIGFEEDMYVFEMHCYGGRLERFAAPNMAMRAKWVGYLLDTLMTKNAQAKRDGTVTPPIESISASAFPTSAPFTRSSFQAMSSIGKALPVPVPLPLVDSVPLASPVVHPASLLAMQSEYFPSSNTTGASERLPVPTLDSPASSTGIIDRGREARSLGTNSQTSVLPNPWDLQSTPTRPGPTSITTPRPLYTATQGASSNLMTARTSSLLMSPRSDRSSMTASPSISRLDERNLVKNRLAMLERQASASPTPAGRGYSHRGSGGAINWGALNEVRSGKTRSSLMRGAAGVASPTGTRVSSPTGPCKIMRPRPGPREVVSAQLRGAGSSLSLTDEPHSSGSLFRPKWPFPEPSVSTGVPEPSGSMSGANGTLPVSNNQPRGLNASTPGQAGIGSPLTSSEEANLRPSFMRLTARPAADPRTTASKPVQVLGNLPPSDKTPRTAPKLTDPVFNTVSERLASLSVALRESDVAHSTKASGIGQLIASTQDHIINAVEESARVSSQEYAATTRHLERLQDTVDEFVGRSPGPGAEGITELSAIKEALERIDEIVSSRLEDIASKGEQAEHENLVIQRIGELKQTVEDLASKTDAGAAQSDALAKLDAISGAISSNASTALAFDPEQLADFIQQIKDHISTVLTTAMNAPSMDTSELVSKLDSFAVVGDDFASQFDLSSVQKILEKIRQLVQGRQLEDAPRDQDSQPMDLSDVMMKLDGIAAMCQSFMESKASSHTEGGGAETQEMQDQLLAALREDAERRTVQTQQTTELVRYSNELNTWLEKFVMNASTQMDSVGTGLSLLRRDLGLDPPLPMEGQADDTRPTNALKELRGMFAEQIKTTGEITTSLNALLTAFNKEQDQNAQARQNLATDAVAKMIDVQRQEQERLLRQLATDLSSDIRGERIRFVEAMSQATSMNVQLHVEEFKKQLTHEVLALTDEVGRLREERKTIQHQIAQLFLVKTEHEAELRSSESFPPRPVLNTRPVPR